MADRSALERFEAALREPRRETYVLRLFVAGAAPSSAQAVARIRSICERYLPGDYDLEIIDVHQQPEQAQDADIIAIPTLLKELPAPLRRIIGDLSNEDRVVVGLGLEPKS